MYTRLRLLSPNYSKSLELNRSRTFTLNSQIFASVNNAIPQRSFANLPRKRTKKGEEESVTTEKPKSVKSVKDVETSGFPSYTEISKFEKKESRKAAQNERTSKLEEKIEDSIEDSIQELPKSTKSSKRSSKSNQTSKSQEIEDSTQKQSKSTKSSKSKKSQVEQSQEIEDSIEEIPKSTKSSKKSKKSKETENLKEKEQQLLQQFEENFTEISDNFVRRNVDHLWKEFYEGTIVLPTTLAEKMRIALEGFPRKQLRQEAEKLSALLR